MPTSSLSSLDLNALLRRALHERKPGENVEGPVRRAVAEVVPPDDAGAVADGILATIRRCARELEVTEDDAAHSVLANVGRFHFNFAPDATEALTEDSLVVIAGRLRRWGDLDASERARIQPTLL